MSPRLKTSYRQRPYVTADDVNAALDLAIAEFDRQALAKSTKPKSAKAKRRSADKAKSLAAKRQHQDRLAASLQDVERRVAKLSPLVDQAARPRGFAGKLRFGQSGFNIRRRK